MALIRPLLLSTSRPGRLLTRRAAPPEDDFGFVDLKTVIVAHDEARRRPEGAIDVEGHATASADQVMMIVAHSIFVPGRRSRRLNPANEILLGQDAEGVVDRLARDRSDDLPDVVDQLVGCAMGTRGHRS